jgi:hypothetical protein
MRRVHPPGSRRGSRAAPAACLAVAVLSLLLQRTPDFDSTAWLIWGRELADGTLSTTGGPSWKPLPVGFTAAFALLGETVAPWLWLVVARLGGLLALVLCFRVTARLAGRTAAIVATAALALATEFAFNAARGDAEGLLVALALLAVHEHLAGRPRAALAAAAGAGLVRPEVWPLLAAYAGWLLLRRGDHSAATLGLCGLAAVAIPTLWFVPEQLGSGEWTRAATRAQHPAPGTPGQSSLPFAMTFLSAAVALAWPVYAGALAAVAFALPAPRPRGTRDATVLALAAAATTLMLIVAAMAQAGFTGSLRYVTLPAALLCVLGGIGLPPLVRRLSPAVRRPALVLAAAGVVLSAGLLVRDAGRLADEQRVYGDQLTELIERAGGREALVACAPIGADHFASQMVAWRLHLRQADVRLGISVRRGTVLARIGTGAAAAPEPPVRLRHGEWLLRSSCRLAAERARASP